MTALSNLSLPLLLVLALGGPAWSAEPVFSLTITGPSGPVEAGADIQLKVTLTNVSDHYVQTHYANTDQAEWQYDVDFRGPDGKEPAKTKDYRDAFRSVRLDKPLSEADRKADEKDYPQGPPTPGPYFLGSRGIAGFELGGSRTNYLNLSKLYDLSKAGKYTVQVSHEDATGTNSVVKSNVFVVTIKK